MKHRDGRDSQISLFAQVHKVVKDSAFANYKIIIVVIKLMKLSYKNGHKIDKKV